MLLADLNHVREHVAVHQRADAVVDDDDIVRGAVLLQVVYAVADGFLTGGAARNDPAQLGDAELLGICPQHVFPALNAHDLDCVDVRMLLKALQRVQQNGLVIDI